MSGPILGALSNNKWSGVPYFTKMMWFVDADTGKWKNGKEKW